MHATSAIVPSRITYRLPDRSAGSRLHRCLLAAGALGPALFDATYTLEGFVRPGYDPMRETISALSLGPSGWIQDVNFLVFGVISLASAYAWRLTLAPGLGDRAIPALKVIIGLGLIVAGLCAMDPTDASGSTLHGNLHNVAAFASLIATWSSSFVLATRFASEPGWRLWSVFAVITAVLVIGSLAAMGVAIGQHGDAGAFERLASLVGLPFGLSVTVRLLQGDARVGRGR